MSEAGYSGTPLPRKLGIKPEHRVLVDGAPEGFVLTDLPPGACVHSRAGREPYDVILLFARDDASLRRRFPLLVERLVTDGGLWVCWPKRSSGLASDLGGNAIRDYVLSTGLVDNKVCAVDAVWSGLRFVRRVEDR